MTPQVVRQRVEQFLQLLVEHQCVVDLNPVVLREFGSSKFVTWDAAGGQFTHLLGGELTLDGYAALVKARTFSAVLRDGSLLQISYSFDLKSVVKHRLCFIPCPLDLTSDDMAQFPLLDWLESVGSPSAEIQLRGPVRFDFDLAAAEAEHPAVHLTVGSSVCRIPVERPLSVGEFAQFVVHNFYPDVHTPQVVESLRALVSICDVHLGVDHGLGLHVRNAARQSLQPF